MPNKEIEQIVKGDRPKEKAQTLMSTIEVRVRLFGTELFVLSSDFCCSSSNCNPIFPMPIPEADRSIDNNVLDRSLDKGSSRDLFLDGIAGKHLLITDKQSLNIFTRSLRWVEHFNMSLT